MKALYTIFLFSILSISLNRLSAQCTVNGNIPIDTITCGDCINLNAFGEGQGVSIFSEDFNLGSPTGWAFTQQATFTNPCSPAGVDGTPHIWMGNNSGVPRELRTQTYNLSTATAGVTICFDMLFSEQGDAAPCEGPDEPDEGVYLQYSTDGGVTWVTLHYFDPNGGNDPALVNWNNWCFQLPLAAITSATAIRWFQDNDSGADYDHWGIDNVNIYFNDPTYNITWTHDSYSYGIGSSGGTNPNAVCPQTTTTYNVTMTNGVQNCANSVTVNVKNPTFRISAAPDTLLCAGECVNLNGEATVVVSPGGLKAYENNQLSIVAGGSAAVNINVTGLNMSSVLPNSIVEVCVNQFQFSGSQICTNVFGGCNCNGTTISFGDACNLTTSSFRARLISPNGCIVELVPQNTGTGAAYNNVCFVPAGGTPIGAGFPTAGQWQPNQPLSGMNGCQSNGVWTLEFDAPGGIAFGLGTFFGWSITFDDPEISYPANFNWSPTTGMTGSGTLNPNICPPFLAGVHPYTLSASDTAGCVTVSDIANITIDACLLPLGLLNFDGLVQKSGNLLQWTVSEGHQFNRFELERSTDGYRNFMRIGKIDAKLGQRSYSLVDQNPKAEGYYRLRMLQPNNEVDYSPVIHLRRTDQLFSNFNVHWSSAQNAIVNFDSPFDNNTGILILSDMLGRTLQKRTITITSGNNVFELNLKSLPAGTYIVRLQSGAAQQLRRIVKAY